VRPAILSPEGIGKIGMVEHVEEFGAELSAETFPELPILRDREIPVPKAGIAEDIAAHRAFGSDGWREHNGTAARVAAIKP